MFSLHRGDLRVVLPLLFIELTYDSGQCATVAIAIHRSVRVLITKPAGSNDLMN